MTTLYPSNFVSPMRRGMIEFAHQISADHDLTLNFHADYRPEAAVSRLTKWFQQVLQRLFGRRCYQLPRERLIEFVAFPELSLAGYPHFHCAARIPGSHVEYFQRIAGSRWKAFVPTGTLHLQPIQQTEEDYERLFSYVTKSASADNLIHSSMLLPVT